MRHAKGDHLNWKRSPARTASCLVTIATIGAFTLVAARSLSQESDAVASPEVWIQIELRALGTSGDVSVPVGFYRVEAGAGSSLRLVPQDGEPIELRATPGAHGEDLAAPIAIWTATGEDEYRVVLLRPDRTTLEAVGSGTGVASRGAEAIGSKELQTILSARAKLQTTIRPAVQPSCDTFPRIDPIAAPIRPGATVFISGVGFCSGLGRLTLAIGTRSFPLAVFSWSDTRLQLSIPSDIRGVRATSDAEVRITTERGGTGVARAAFQPLLDKKDIYLGWWEIQGTYLGISEDKWMGDGSLINDHKIVGTWVHHTGEGHCEVSEPPPYNTPGVSIRSKVHQGARGGTVKVTTTCMPYLKAEGPVGLPAE
jgi:hypothetical protein